MSFLPIVSRRTMETPRLDHKASLRNLWKMKRRCPLRTWAMAGWWVPWVLHLPHGFQTWWKEIGNLENRNSHKERKSLTKICSYLVKDRQHPQWSQTSQGEKKRCPPAISLLPTVTWSLTLAKGKWRTPTSSLWGSTKHANTLPRLHQRTQSRGRTPAS